MNPDTEGKRDEALSFLVNHDSGVLSTVSNEGHPRSRLVYYTGDDVFNIYFLTLSGMRKTQDLATHPFAAFVVSETDIPKTLQVEGEVADITDSATMNPMLTDFIRTLMSKKQYGIPVEHFDAAAIKLYKLTPTWVRWGDFTFGHTSEEVFTDVTP